ncbi:MAG: DUF6128 domain-containing protein [Eubacteriales bacterium]|nr:DUF6128 domain-containing protein [Eubacteriales bacterium]
MSSYKRFISYVYEYENDQKSVNRGFMKVECRNGICLMMFSLRGLCRNGNGSVKIYGFRRDGSDLSLSLLSTQEVFGGILNLHLQFSDMDIGENHFSLEELSGILLACSQHICYITQWDDDALDVRQLFAGSVPKQEPEVPVSEAEPPALEEDVTQPPENPSEENEPPEDQKEPSEEQKTPDLQATSTECSGKEEMLPCFKDGSIINCVKITSRDLKKLNPQDWHLCSNRFVHYGQQIFGHLLIGQLAETGQTVLCVPGTYHQQECFMANMFGFPYFIQCSIEKSTRCCFGYWYRLIQPTDLNKRNCPS